LERVAKIEIKELRDRLCHVKIGFELYWWRSRTITSIDRMLKKLERISKSQVSERVDFARVLGAMEISWMEAKFLRQIVD
jgi:hypothetical protein